MRLLRAGRVEFVVDDGADLGVRGGASHCDVGVLFIGEMGWCAMVSGDLLVELTVL